MRGVVVIVINTVQVSAQASVRFHTLHALIPRLDRQLADGAPGNAYPLADTLVGMIRYPTLFTAFLMALIFLLSLSRSA